jgi:hypothetical protein
LDKFYCTYKCAKIGTKLLNLSHQLEDFDIKVSDDWKIWILLGGLPASYEPFLMSLFNLKEPMTVDERVGKLLAIDDLKNTSEQQNKEEIAMYTQGKK